MFRFELYRDCGGRFVIVATKDGGAPRYFDFGIWLSRNLKNESDGFQLIGRCGILEWDEYEMHGRSLSAPTEIPATWLELLIRYGIDKQSAQELIVKNWDNKHDGPWYVE